jgi:hypothetical protein
MPRSAEPKNTAQAGGGQEALASTARNGYERQGTIKLKMQPPRKEGRPCAGKCPKARLQPQREKKSKKPTGRRKPMHRCAIAYCAIVVSVLSVVMPSFVATLIGFYTTSSKLVWAKNLQGVISYD